MGITQTVNVLTNVGALITPTDFTVPNARLFYSSMGNPSAVKGLKLRMDFFGPCTSLCMFYSPKEWHYFKRTKIEVELKIRIAHWVCSSSADHYDLSVLFQAQAY